jgi:hypothetical protein
MTQVLVAHRTASSTLKAQQQQHQEQQQQQQDKEHHAEPAEAALKSPSRPSRENVVTEPVDKKEQQEEEAEEEEEDADPRRAAAAAAAAEQQQQVQVDQDRQQQQQQSPAGGEAGSDEAMTDMEAGQAEQDVADSVLMREVDSVPSASTPSGGVLGSQQLEPAADQLDEVMAAAARSSYPSYILKVCWSLAAGILRTARLCFVVCFSIALL